MASPGLNFDRLGDWRADCTGWSVERIFTAWYLLANFFAAGSTKELVQTVTFCGDLKFALKSSMNLERSVV